MANGYFTICLGLRGVDVPDDTRAEPGNII